MEKVAAIWNFAPLLGPLIAIIVLVFVIARLWRSRAPQVPARNLQLSPAEPDDDVVDSSHIGFAPLVGSAGNQINLDADGTADGDGSRGGRR
jgi:phosphate/sulfate permease